MNGGSARSLSVVDVDVRKKPKTARKTVSRRKPVVKVKKSPAKKPNTKTPKKTISKKRTSKIKKLKVLTKKSLPKSRVSKSKKKITKVEVVSLNSQKSVQSLKREPLGHLLVEQKLRQAGFIGGISSDKEFLDIYCTDESIFSIRPQIVIQPKRAKDVEIAVRVIGQSTHQFPSLSLTPRATGAGLSGGSLTDSIVIDMNAHMFHIGNIIEKKEVITFTCEPGALWSDVQKHLKEHNAYLPPYPLTKNTCTIGGSVANNVTGPNSHKHGNIASWIESLDVTLYDGKIYTIKALTYKEFKSLIKKDNAYGLIAKQIFDIIKRNEKTISETTTSERSSNGFALRDVIDGTALQFEKGKATFDLTKLIAGSQGTIGIITSMTLRAEKIVRDTSLVAIPVFSTRDAGKVLEKALSYDPVTVQIFDGLTFDLALKNPDFFKTRLKGTNYYRVLLSMYRAFHVRYRRKLPELTILVTFDSSVQTPPGIIAKQITEETKVRARLVQNPIEKEMLSEIHSASYSLAKRFDPEKRPAAFLEDMNISPENFSGFLSEVKKMLHKNKVTAVIHGHGGNGHLHFYPLLDFTAKNITRLIETLTKEFTEIALAYDGVICGEHNDGIMHTPQLSKVFNKKMISLFKDVEYLFDPQDIFNPGKKVNPRFDIKDSLRKTN